eukprot:8683975-Ditylum_brightwellii.AAC.1
MGDWQKLPINNGESHNWRKEYSFGQSSIMPEIHGTAMSGSSQKVAVVMSSRMKNEEGIIKELERIKVDMDVLAKSNQGSCWFIRDVMVDDALVSFFT